jgi:enediyne biosynthesis protein E4
MLSNQGDGTFRDLTRETGVEDDRFSAGCSWGDFDRDGNIDLYVCNYVDFRHNPETKNLVDLQYSSEQPFTLNPSSYRAQSNSLFRNRGNGTFEEVGKEAGVVDPDSRSLSASWADLDNDGWIDLYVANDVSKNDVYLNLRNGKFKDIGAASLAADYRGAMGIAVSDFDNDSDHDLLISHWIAQENGASAIKCDSSHWKSLTGSNLG